MYSLLAPSQLCWLAIGILVFCTTIETATTTLRIQQKSSSHTSSVYAATSLPNNRKYSPQQQKQQRSFITASSFRTRIAARTTTHTNSLGDEDSYEYNSNDDDANNRNSTTITTSDRSLLFWGGNGDSVDQTNIKQFELWESEEIAKTVPKWAIQYPNLLKYTTAQKAYGLPAAGDESDCPFDDDGPGCHNIIYTLQDYVRHPEGSDSSNALPEVLWSGELHGNERVGPTSVLEATQLLLDSATCEAMPHEHLRLTDVAAWALEVQSAKECRAELNSRGITDVQRQWLARLIGTRRIVVLPTANALGYFRNDRTENSIDPNRDFPYDYGPDDTSNCMQTIAGRTVNEVFREHMFQLSLTFHGGSEVIGYEWGAPSYGDNLSPDDTAQVEIANAYSEFAGSFHKTPKYLTGTMTETVYAVRGGMEDWAYAGSWDSKLVLPCTPTTYNGYDASKTTYDDKTLRAFNMLIETSNQKIPKTDALGTTEQILDNSEVGNGHVARNVRLALLAAELVEPYVQLQAVRGHVLTDGIVPLTECGKPTTVSVPKTDADNVRIEWTVGGSISVDVTKIYVTGVTKDIEQALQCYDNQPAPDVLSKFTEVSVSSGTPSSGSTHFSTSGESTVFSADIDINEISDSGQVYVYAAATVDGTWGATLPNVEPKIAPQSHIANARTNPDWSYERDDGKYIQGRLEWFSVPIIISVSSSSTDVVHEISSRFDSSSSTDGGRNDASPNASLNWGVILVAVVLGIPMIFCLARRSKMRFRRDRRERISTEYEESADTEQQFTDNGQVELGSFA